MYNFRWCRVRRSIEQELVWNKFLWLVRIYSCTILFCKCVNIVLSHILTSTHRRLYFIILKNLSFNIFLHFFSFVFGKCTYLCILTMYIRSKNKVLQNHRKQEIAFLLTSKICIVQMSQKFYKIEISFSLFCTSVKENSPTSNTIQYNTLGNI